MDQSTCSCEYVQRMIADILKMRGEYPGEVARFVDFLYPEKDASGSCNTCCLMTFLIYYGFCHECSETISEHARTLFAPVTRTKG